MQVAELLPTTVTGTPEAATVLTLVHEGARRDDGTRPVAAAAFFKVVLIWHIIASFVKPRLRLLILASVSRVARDAVLDVEHYDRGSESAATNRPWRGTSDDCHPRRRHHGSTVAASAAVEKTSVVGPPTAFGDAVPGHHHATSSSCPFFSPWWRDIVLDCWPFLHPVVSTIQLVVPSFTRRRDPPYSFETLRCPRQEIDNVVVHDLHGVLLWWGRGVPLSATLCDVLERRARLPLRNVVPFEAVPSTASTDVVADAAASMSTRCDADDHEEGAATTAEERPRRRHGDDVAFRLPPRCAQLSVCVNGLAVPVHSGSDYDRIPLKEWQFPQRRRPGWVGDMIIGISAGRETSNSSCQQVVGM